jgi:hypothetical protein
LDEFGRLEPKCYQTGVFHVELIYRASSSYA